MSNARPSRGEPPGQAFSHEDFSGSGDLAYLGERLRDILVHDPRVGEQDIQLAVEEQQLVLAGSVTTEERHRAIMEVVNELLPGIIVRDDLRIVHVGDSPKVERLR